MTPLERRVAWTISRWDGQPDPATVDDWARSRPSVLSAEACARSTVAARFLSRHEEIERLVRDEVAAAVALQAASEFIDCARSHAFEIERDPMPKPRHRSRIAGPKGKQFVTEYPDADGEADEVEIARLALPYAPAEPWAGPIVLHVEARLAITPSWDEWRKEASLARALPPFSLSAGHGGGDVDNLAKQLMDAIGMAALERLWEKKGAVAARALCGGLALARFWHDDAQIVELRVRKVYAAQPSWLVGLYCLDEMTKAKWAERSGLFAQIARPA